MGFRRIFITGIGTDVGKTIASAVLAEALQADYWKPIQAGTEPVTDSQWVKSVLSNPISKIHPESYLLKQAMSPHAAAAMENLKIEFDKIEIPDTSNTLIIEGAGGLMVPLNDKQTIADLIKHLDAEVVVVIRNYLGSINHSLLTIEKLKQLNLNISGCIISGNENKESERFILNYTGIKLLGRIEEEKEWSKEIVKKYTEHFVSIR